MAAVVDKTATDEDEGQDPILNILFVYKADSGLFNTMADIGHKIFSPDTYQCDLCQLTHGYFSERTEWREFIGKQKIECRFLHRDEFFRVFPERSDTLPAVFIQQEDRLDVCIGAERLHQYDSLDKLISALKENCLMDRNLA